MGTIRKDTVPWDYFQKSLWSVTHIVPLIDMFTVICNGNNHKLCFGVSWDPR